MLRCDDQCHREKVQRLVDFQRQWSTCVGPLRQLGTSSSLARRFVSVKDCPSSLFLCNSDRDIDRHSRTYILSFVRSFFISFDFASRISSCRSNAALPETVTNIFKHRIFTKSSPSIVVRRKLRVSRIRRFASTWFFSSSVKKAYRQLALRYHPDRTDIDQKEDAKTKFQIIGKVYAILSDEEKRKIYDETGESETDDRLDQRGFHSSRCDGWWRSERRNQRLVRLL